NQGTIVATGTIRSVGDERRMFLTSTYDHRIIQGAESGLFLQRIERLLAGEDGFYQDVFAAMNAGEPGPDPEPGPNGGSAEGPGGETPALDAPSAAESVGGPPPASPPAAAPPTSAAAAASAPVQAPP